MPDNVEAYLTALNEVLKNDQNVFIIPVSDKIRDAIVKKLVELDKVVTWKEYRSSIRIRWQSRTTDQEKIIINTENKG